MNALATIGAFVAEPAMLEALLLVAVLGAGLVAGSLGLLMFGNLLGEDWLRPVHGPLLAMALLVPVVGALALPVLLGLEQLYPWASTIGDPPVQGPRAAWLEPDFFRLRAAAVLSLWVLLAILAAVYRGSRLLGAVGLALLVPSAALAAQDWVMSRDPIWLGSLQGLALFVEQLAVALAAAVLVLLARRGLPERAPARGLERALLTLAVAIMWLWFIQFVVVWAADLPTEAAWYLRRYGGWAWLKLGLLVPALAGAIALAAPPRSGALRLALVCLLLLVTHVGHLFWLLRPEVLVEAPPAWLDAVAVAGLLLVWAGCALLGLRRSRVPAA